MKKIPSILLCLAAGLPVLAGAEGLLVQVPAALDAAAPITGHVRAECNVPELVGNHVLGQVALGRANVRPMAAPPANSPDTVLLLTVLSAYGVGGGGWSGPKSVSLRAELVENGRSIGTTVLQRSSRGGVWGGVSGTCAIFERVAQALGKDVAAWLPYAYNNRAMGNPSPPGTGSEPAVAPQ